MPRPGLRQRKRTSKNPRAKIPVKGQPRILQLKEKGRDQRQRALTPPSDPDLDIDQKLARVHPANLSLLKRSWKIVENMFSGSLAEEDLSNNKTHMCIGLQNWDQCQAMPVVDAVDKLEEVELAALLRDIDFRIRKEDREAEKFLVHFILYETFLSVSEKRWRNSLCRIPQQ